jgi:regulator of RNase E activity RraB
MTNYPDDADGDALSRVAHDGSDMRMPMLIDFQITAPTEQSVRQIATTARNLGYHVKINGQGHNWTCECSTRMLATYDGVVAIQQELASLSRPHGGRPDGWGTFGNGPLATA